MSILAMIFLALGMSMDAFAAALARGTRLPRYLNFFQLLKTGAIFGGIEMLAPLLGYFIGALTRQWVSEWDHWLAFVLLSILGLHMIYEAFHDDEEYETQVVQTTGKKDVLMLVMTAFATSIDSLVVGVGLAFLNVNIFIAALLIGLATTTMATLGLYLGRILGDKIGKWAEIAGGVVLIVIGCSVLMEHLHLFG